MVRLLAEILVVAALIAAGWQKSFHESASEMPFVGSYLSSPRPPAREEAAVASKTPPVVKATPNRSELLSPTHRTVLDTPAENAPKTFTGHIFYTDENGKKYWLDAQGKRHYE